VVEAQVEASENVGVVGHFDWIRRILVFGPHAVAGGHSNNGGNYGSRARRAMYLASVLGYGKLSLRNNITLLACTRNGTSSTLLFRSPLHF
jgi:hypothetical protein